MIRRRRVFRLRRPRRLTAHEQAAALVDLVMRDRRGDPDARAVLNAILPGWGASAAPSAAATTMRAASEPERHRRGRTSSDET